uniref:Uncharacterized protein n=1 Tax=Zea mays TaxID=4577 RepID=B6U872_MAIZE|nr:hypothetical protein [Zea mays]
MELSWCRGLRLLLVASLLVLSAAAVAALATRGEPASARAVRRRRALRPHVRPSRRAPGAAHLVPHSAPQAPRWGRGAPPPPPARADAASGPRRRRGGGDRRALRRSPSGSCRRGRTRCTTEAHAGRTPRRRRGARRRSVHRFLDAEVLMGQRMQAPLLGLSCSCFPAGHAP